MFGSEGATLYELTLHNMNEGAVSQPPISDAYQLRKFKVGSTSILIFIRHLIHHFLYLLPLGIFGYQEMKWILPRKTSCTCADHLPGNIRSVLFKRWTLKKHICIEKRYFRCTYCGSIFTLFIMSIL